MDKLMFWANSCFGQTMLERGLAMPVIAECLYGSVEFSSRATLVTAINGSQCLTLSPLVYVLSVQLVCP